MCLKHQYILISSASQCGCLESLFISSYTISFLNGMRSRIWLVGCSVCWLTSSPSLWIAFQFYMCLHCGFWDLPNVHRLGQLKAISETELSPSSGGEERRRSHSASLVDRQPRSSHMLPPGSFRVILHRSLLANKHEVLEASFGFIISRRTKLIVLRP
jgi:hypothetical protein